MRFLALGNMANTQYYYPSGRHNLRLRQKVIDYLKNNPNTKATDEQIRYRISEKATNEKRRSIPLSQIRELRRIKIVDSTDIYLVIGKLRIYDWDESPPLLISTEDYFQYEREFLSLSSAKRHYKDMIINFTMEINEFAGIPNIELRTGHLALTKTEWYNTEKRFPVIEETIW